jgi:uncharacterized membrane protein YhiD involved in acid resistance
MENLVLDSINNIKIELPLFSTSASIVLAAIFGEWIALLYRRFGISLANRKVFSDVFWLLSVTTCIVIMVVKFSIALSLGLVGALSIVRFRAAIKEPEELVHLFLVIALGIACGAGQVRAAFTVIVITTLVFFIRFWLYKNKANSMKKDYATGAILNISGPANKTSLAHDFLNTTFGNANYSIVSMNFRDDNCEATYRINIELTETNHSELLKWASSQAQSGLEINFGSQTFLAT